MLESQVMLFCEYPFERPEDADNRHRFTIVLERVLNVQYTIPAGEPLLCVSSVLLEQLHQFDITNGARMATSKAG